MTNHISKAALAALAMATAAIFASPVSAQDAGGKAKGPAAAFERLDKNNDGVVDRAESEQPAEKFFKRGDANDDGFIDADEAKKLVDGASARKPKAGENMEKRLKKLDADRDGKVSKAEAVIPPSWFERTDADKDGKATKAELDSFVEKRGDRRDAKDSKKTETPKDAAKPDASKDDAGKKDDPASDDDDADAGMDEK